MFCQQMCGFVPYPLWWIQGVLSLGTLTYLTGSGPLHELLLVMQVRNGQGGHSPVMGTLPVKSNSVTVT